MNYESVQGANHGQGFQMNVRERNKSLWSDGNFNRSTGESGRNETHWGERRSKMWRIARSRGSWEGDEKRELNFVGQSPRG